MEARQYAARNRAGNDWFGHSDDQSNPPPPEAPKQPSPRDTGEQSNKTAMIKPVCNSNQWFRHEGKGAHEDKDESRVPRDHHDHGDHDHHPHSPPKPNGDAPTPQEPMTAINTSPESTSPRHNGAEQRSKASKEGEANCQRDKASSDWFCHHDPSKPVANPRAGSAESSSNAMKMRNESENWFSHDPRAPSEPLHLSKGRTSSNQPNKEMYNIFHHNG